MKFLAEKTDFVEESTSKRKVWWVQGSKKWNPPNFTILKTSKLEITDLIRRDVDSSLSVKSAHDKSWWSNDHLNIFYLADSIEAKAIYGRGPCYLFDIVCNHAMTVLSWNCNVQSVMMSTNIMTLIMNCRIFLSRLIIIVITNQLQQHICTGPFTVIVNYAVTHIQGLQ